RLSSLSILSFSRLPPPPRSSLFPYTTLFRSGEFPGDLAQGQLRSAELLRDELPGAMLGELPRGFLGVRARARQRLEVPAAGADRSEEHTSELQSPYDLVCRLLLEKKKKQLSK